MNFKDLQISFDALLIAAIEDTSNERLTQFADFFKKIVTDCKSGFSQEDLEYEDKMLKSIILQCRKEALDLKMYLSGEKVWNVEQMNKVLKTRTTMRNLSAYGIGAVWFWIKYMEYKGDSLRKLLLLNKSIFLKKSKKYARITKVSNPKYSKFFKIKRIAGLNDSGKTDQQRRRHWNNHTIKDHLKVLWGIDVGSRKNEYESLCDCFESILYEPPPIKEYYNEKSKEKRKNKRDQDGKRIKYRMNFFAMLKNRNKIPWDLFDGTKGAVIPNKPYRYVMNEFLQEIMRMAGESAALAYMVLKSFWEKWYNDFITAMYNVGLSGHPPENISAFYRMIWSLEPKDEKTEFCGSLFSEVLFNLLKEEMKLKLYQFQYILKHSMIKMESLNEKQLKVRPLFMDPKVALCEVSYDEAKKVIRQYWREVQIFLGYDADVSKSFSHAMKLMQLIVEPNKQTVAFWKIITMMQCCATPLNNNFTITRYGMDGGEKNVKLSTIILRPANNDGIETRLYLVHLMRRRYFMNLFDRETVDQIDRYRLALEEGVSNSLDNMGSWDTIRPTLAGIRYAYDEAVEQYASELGLI